MLGDKFCHPHAVSLGMLTVFSHIALSHPPRKETSDADEPRRFCLFAALRLCQKCGLARQAIATAERYAPDLAALFHMVIHMRPNAKGLERLAFRHEGRPGVTRVSMAGDGKGLTVTARDVRKVDARAKGETAFRETGLIYIHAKIGMSGGRLGLSLSAVSYSCLEVQRLVERSDVDLQTALLRQVDAEAHAVFRAWGVGAKIEEAEDEHYAAAVPGLWAGEHDRMAVDAEWGLDTTNAPTMLVFSAGTYLSEGEMRSTVWPRWKDDPTCQMV